MGDLYDQLKRENRTFNSRMNKMFTWAPKNEAIIYGHDLDFSIQLANHLIPISCLTLLEKWVQIVSIVRPLPLPWAPNNKLSIMKWHWHYMYLFVKEHWEPENRPPQTTLIFIVWMQFVYLHKEVKSFFSVRHTWNSKETCAWERPPQFYIKIAIKQLGYDLLVEITWKPKIEIDISSKWSSHIH